MRIAWLTLLAAVGGCYSPVGEATCSVRCAGADAPCPGSQICGANLRCEQPGGAVCGPGGEVIDAPLVEADAFMTPDAPVDAPGTHLCFVPNSTMLQALSSGSDFTPNQALSRAAILRFDPAALVKAIFVAETNINSPSAPFVNVLTPPFFNAESVSAPRMAPDGMTIFMRTDDPNFGGRIASSNWLSPAQWTAPLPLNLRDTGNVPASIDATAVPGTPSGVSPRRIPISLLDGGFVEYEEVSATPRTWREKFRYSLSDLGVKSLGTPNFTADGRRVVFIGTTMIDPLPKIYYAERGALVTKFGQATALYDAPGSTLEGAPYMSVDCTFIYFTDLNVPKGLRAL